MVSHTNTAVDQALMQIAKHVRAPTSREPSARESIRGPANPETNRSRETKSCSA